MNRPLSTAETAVVARLAEDITRRVRPSSTSRYHTIEDTAGQRVGHRAQQRTVESLEKKGFLRYVDGVYELTIAGQRAQR